MRIGNHLIRHNYRQPDFIINLLQARTQHLAVWLGRRLGEHFQVTFAKSSRSEASYITILCTKTGHTHDITFRNHKTGKSYDTIIWLSDYASWIECKRSFIKKTLPAIMKIFETVQSEQPSLTPIH